MGQWKLATVLLATSFVSALVCITAAAQLWDYAYPRSVFLSGAYFFALSSLLFFLTVFFLDDLSEWIKKRSSFWLKGILSLFFALSFTFLMTLALYMGAIGGRSLLDLSVCGFNTMDTICTKKQDELSEADLTRVKKPLIYHLSFGDHPYLKQGISAVGFEIGEK